MLTDSYHYFIPLQYNSFIFIAIYWHEVRHFHSLSIIYQLRRSACYISLDINTNSNIYCCYS
ncbi:hypothetical protein FKN51_22730 [Escherichia coli]|nr:hypothetical protein [Escherichia coli]EEY6222070.1 hypothetical protein [Escherichia coli]EFB1429300.1 hypothetical protein [Escherichia coli]EFW6867255.1 hypothetical protein [Shigella sonnei]KAA0504861.1 hypothetical protein F0317_09075 [Escherichia coli]